MKLLLSIACILLSNLSIAQHELLAGKWQYQAITNANDEEVKTLSPDDYLAINEDSSFYYYLQKEHIYATGKASQVNNQLILQYDLIPNATGVDSVIVNNNSIAYYLNGNAFKIIEASVLGFDSINGSITKNKFNITAWNIGDSIPTIMHSASSLIKRIYQLEKLTTEQLVISEHDITFSFNKPVVFKEAVAGFSFWGVFKGLLSIVALLIIGFLASENKRAIKWSLIYKGLALQMVFAILILKVSFVEAGFEWISAIFVKVISFSQDGAKFLFSSFDSGIIESPMVNFVVMVLPTIIFFSALTALFYYWGILQRIVYAFAWVMKRLMKLSGAESLAAAGNIFLGQTESPLLVRPYLANMTRSEIMCLMSGGMATIAGGVLAAYIGFLGGGSPAEQIFFAKHLLAASVMSAPAAVVAAKLLVPETEKFSEKFSISKDKLGSNVLEAISNGTTDGLKLAINVGAMLLVFIAMISLGNFVLSELIGANTGLNEWIAANTNYTELSFQFLIGYLFSPLAWLMGVDSHDVVLVGQLLGEKTILNEFYAYVTLGDMKSSGMFANGKSIIISTYILCGFANFASIGIQIGGIGALVPNRKALLSSLGVRALIAGTIACLFTAAIVGMFYQ